MSEELYQRILMERKLEDEFGIALSNYGFVTCSHWPGVEHTDKTIWDALIAARLELERLRSVETSQETNPKKRTQMRPNQNPERTGEDR